MLVCGNLTEEQDKRGTKQKKFDLGFNDLAAPYKLVKIETGAKRYFHCNLKIRNY